MFGNNTKVKIDKVLMDKVKRVADLAGYATPDEFIADVLDKELRNFEGSQSDDDIKNKLRGLGYIS